MSYEPEPINITEDQTEPSQEDEDFFKLVDNIKARQVDIAVLLEKPVFRQRLRIICKTFTKDPADAEDLASEVCIKVWLKLDQFKPEPGKRYGNFFAWMRRIAQNLVITGYRRKSIIYSDTRPEDLVDLLDDRTNVASAHESRALFKRFWTVVVEFGPMAETIIKYRFLDYSLREIEERLAQDGISYSHVSCGNLLNDIVDEFFKREEGRPTATVRRKGEQPSGLRDKGYSPSKGKRKIGS